MIGDALLTALYYMVVIITSPLTLLSDVSIPPEIEAGLGTAGSVIHGLADIFPVFVLIVIFGVYIVVEFAIFVYKGIMWLIKKIPTIS